jgi:hypothetical protein
MSPELRGACAEMFRALAIESRDTLRLRGERIRCDPDRIVSALHVAVYTHFYCGLTNTAATMSRPELLAALAAANAGGLSHVAGASPAGGVHARTGDAGTYLAWGPWQDRGARWLRLYWNVGPHGAVDLMARTPAILNRAHVPFRLKVLLDVSVRRRDAVVLYLPRERWPAAGTVLAGVYGAIEASGTLRPETPLFTKSVRPGVGLAEDPGTGASFGVHRAGIVARAIAKSYLRGRVGDEGRWEDLGDEFALDGLSLGAPYLNAGSRDVYALSGA